MLPVLEVLKFIIFVQIYLFSHIFCLFLILNLQVKKLRYHFGNDSSFFNGSLGSMDMSSEALADFHSQIQSAPWENDQPELKVMILHQASTIFFTLFGNLLMIFVIKRHNIIKKRRKLTPVQVTAEITENT